MLVPIKSLYCLRLKRHFSTIMRGVSAFEWTVRMARTISPYQTLNACPPATNATFCLRNTGTNKTTRAKNLLDNPPRHHIILFVAACASVAHLAEQLIRNQQVVGSIPTAGSIFWTKMLLQEQFFCVPIFKPLP